jgi:hypothetical protein
MKKGKLIAGVAVGAAIALFLIPKTRRMITDAVAGLNDSLKDMASHAGEMTDKAKGLVIS